MHKKDFCTKCSFQRGSWRSLSGSGLEAIPAPSMELDREFPGWATRPPSNRIFSFFLKSLFLLILSWAHLCPCWVFNSHLLLGKHPHECPFSPPSLWMCPWECVPSLLLPWKPRWGHSRRDLSSQGGNSGWQHQGQDPSDFLGVGEGKGSRELVSNSGGCQLCWSRVWSHLALLVLLEPNPLRSQSWEIFSVSGICSFCRDNEGLNAEWINQSELCVQSVWGEFRKRFLY